MCVYLVTGGAGFIGSNFVKYLLEVYKEKELENKGPLEEYRDIKIIILDKLSYASNVNVLNELLKDPRCVFIKGDVKDTKVVNDIFKQDHIFEGFPPINYVVNFAAETHVDRSITNPQIFFETNVLGTQNLLEIAKKYWTIGKNKLGYPVYKKKVKFLQVSTDEVYGELGINDKAFTETSPLNPSNPYSASKAAADLMVKAYHTTFKMPVNITRSSNNYGPHQFPEKLIPLAIKNIHQGLPVPIYGNGGNIRDWIYVEDNIQAIIRVLHCGRKGQVYNIGSNEQERNIDIVKLINILAGGNYIFVQDRLGHDKRYAMDTTKITKELKWKASTSLVDGMFKTIEWYENQN